MVIALGFFDGIHIGHAALLRMACAVARALFAAPAMLTFDTHPDDFNTDTSTPLLTSPEERAALARELFGLNNVIVLQFDDDLRNMPWEDFLLWLVNDFHAKHFVVGHDFRFGRGASGNADKLAEKCAEFRRQGRDVTCSVIPPVYVDGQTVSSTLIRRLLLNGEVAEAAKFLGHYHRLTDIVRFGYKLGRTIGAPTINMQFPPHVIVPRKGVYVTRLQIEGEREIHYAVTNIGTRPTVSGGSDSVTVESYVLDFDRMVYGKRVTLEFIEFLRPEIKFASLDELKARIAVDAELVRDLVGKR